MRWNAQAMCIWVLLAGAEQAAAGELWTWHALDATILKISSTEVTLHGRLRIGRGTVQQGRAGVITKTGIPRTSVYLMGHPRRGSVGRPPTGHRHTGKRNPGRLHQATGAAGIDGSDPQANIRSLVARDAQTNFENHSPGHPRGIRDRPVLSAHSDEPAGRRWFLFCRNCPATR